MTKVEFGQYDFKVKEEDNKKLIFDIARKKWVSLSPEEWVRQHILHYLIHDKKYPVSLIAVERGIELNGTQKRFDLVIFSNTGKPKMIIECKAPEEALNEKVFEQIARYNLSLKVDYLWVTNGTLNYVSKLIGGIELLEEVPEWDAVIAG
jgi:type I restriction and modification enzyme subunit R-like protein